MTGGVLLVLLEALFHHFSLIGRLDLVATFVPSLALLVVVAAVVVAVAILGRTASDAERAWWATVGGLLTKRATYWTAGMATIFYLPGVFYAADGMTRSLIGLGWLATAAMSLFAVRYVAHRQQAAGGGWLLWCAALAAAIFFTGLLAATALFVSLFANMPSLRAPVAADIGPFAYYLRGIEGTSILALALLAAGSGILYALARRLIDVNLFTLGAVESDRLTRCYLAASRPIAAWRRRWSSPRDQRVIVGAPSLSGPAAEQALVRGNLDSADGLEPGDDIELRALRIGRESGDAPVYWGPHLLFNTTMIASEHNAAGRQLGNQSFTLSSLYCGSTSVGYVPTDNPSDAGFAQPNLWLGRVAALAGSAGESRMPRLLRALTTLFSTRSGMWLEKPRMAGWAAAGPQVGNLPVAAAAGLDDDGGDFLYLTGGAEFERLGVYELIRRRCRFIIAVDAGQGGGSPGDNLAQLIGRCRIDFGIRIEIDNPPHGQPGPEVTRTPHCTTCRIHYCDVDEEAPVGELVYVTLAVTGDEPPDTQEFVRNIAHAGREAVNSRRAIDDRQFECGRFLGDHAARSVFGEAACQLSEHAPGRGRNSHSDYVGHLFAAVANRPGNLSKSDVGLRTSAASQLPVQADDQREAALQTEPGGDSQSDPPAPPSSGRGRSRGATRPVRMRGLHAALESFAEGRSWHVEPGRGIGFDFSFGLSSA